MKVKICGLTNLSDALKACEFGADAVGFIFYQKSPRYISVQNAREICAALPPFVKKVGVFVNEKAEIIDNICEKVGLDLAQIHFEMQEECIAKLRTPHIRVVRAKTKDDILKFRGKFRLIDAFVDSFGGEGKRVDLSWFEGADCQNIIIAGGLDAENLAQIKGLNFYGADVNSGVESEYGKKDEYKMRDFIKAARAL